MNTTLSFDSFQRLSQRLKQCSLLHAPVVVQVTADGRQLAVRRTQLVYPVRKEIRVTHNSLTDKPAPHTAGGLMESGGKLLEG